MKMLNFAPNYFQMMLCMSQYKDVTVININISGVDLNKTSASKECKVCHYWFFEDIGFESEEHVCNECLYILTMGYSLENIFNLGAKGRTFRCILMRTSKNEALKRLNNSVTKE